MKLLRKMPKIAKCILGNLGIFPNKQSQVNLKLGR
jgi:hypothetical protein